mmetsp:Transcript_138967/g.241652  ORF Transcript_138967/g.241652 Transcript_138967/m.241652 type:complete len:418 (+) Transcript_138967:557-1810(+)
MFTLGDDSWGLAASVTLKVGQLLGNSCQRLHHVKLVLSQVTVLSLILLEVQAHGGTGHAGARQPEDDSRTIFEDEADTLVLGDTAINRINVFKDVVGLHLHATEILSDQLTRLVGHHLHHLLGLRLVNTLVVVSGIVVTAIRFPVLVCNVLHGDNFTCRFGLLGQNLEPGKHSPHTILLAHVVGTSSERLFTANEGCVSLLVREIVSAAVHQIAEEFPAGGHLEAIDTPLGSHDVQSTRGRHRTGATLQTILELRNEVRISHDHSQRVRGRNEELGTENHVPVCVTISSCSERWNRLAGFDLQAFLVETHVSHQLDGVRQVGVGVAVPSGFGASEVWQGGAILDRSRCRPQLALQNPHGIGTLDATHAIIGHGEIWVGHQLLHAFKVEALLQHGQVVLDAVENLHGTTIGQLEGLNL